MTKAPMAKQSRDNASHDFDAYRAVRHFGSLDGLRFLCIFAVLWHHGPIRDITPDPIQLLMRGFLGVDFFFVLSGFLITTLLLREETRKGSFSLVDFYWRRLCRIVPVYFLVVSFVAFYYIVVKDQHGLIAILPYYYLFLSNFLSVDIPTLGPTWSLAVEEQYYLLWPLLLLLLPRRYILHVLLALVGLNVVAVAGLLAPLGIVPIHLKHLVLALPTATYAPILMGSLVAILLHGSRGYRVAHRLFGNRYAPFASFIALALFIQATPADLTALPNFAIHAMMCICLMTLVLREDHALKPVLSLGPVARVGAISYGIYLYHLLALHVVTQLSPVIGLEPGVISFIAYVMLSILVAEVSFRTFEAYFLRFKNHRPFAAKIRMRTSQGDKSRV